ncbi:hypothetical protein AW27_018695 [Streptomyces sp. PCS3-D2]|uniref:hypothetical protein n=1 Tax=Streptomyces sp. PCS3-D2 TaxID=1460244 RepID=UPI000448A9F2|nr:hypothetical protein [Streptomyces sp. PCS3-D2]WKV73369.1 hypothetical protein AW27_018695 [Streptomyces sp. PCS3-D2]
MGIESDHLVYEYLSAVGDLAQRRHLASGDRMRLVAGLRDEIDRRRAKYDPETPAAVRRILERIGTPEEVLDALGSGQGAASAAGPAEQVPSVPAQRAAGRLRLPGVPPPRPAPEQEPEAQNVPPHLAGLDELGPSGGAEPDWWRMTPGGYGRGPQVEGFAGGIEMPGPFEKEPGQDAEEEAAGAAGAPGPPDSRTRTLVRFLRDRRRAKAAAAAEAGAQPEEATAPARPRPNAFLLLAAAVLVAGVVSGQWLLLVIGWLLPYASRVLGPAERKWAVFGPPGVFLAGAAVWLWGRTHGTWGESLADDQVGGAVQGMWPWLLRGAALASVLYLVWRARRR